jgi:hypothetical protein
VDIELLLELCRTFVLLLRRARRMLRELSHELIEMAAEASLFPWPPVRHRCTSNFDPAMMNAWASAIAPGCSEMAQSLRDGGGEPFVDQPRKLGTGEAVPLSNDGGDRRAGIPGGEKLLRAKRKLAVLVGNSVGKL